LFMRKKERQQRTSGRCKVDFQQVVDSWIFLRSKYTSKSMILLHWNQRRDVTTTNWAGLLGLNELFTAILTHTEVTARHYKSVFGIG